MDFQYLSRRAAAGQAQLLAREGGEDIERLHGQLCHDEESCIIIHHDESSCMTHGEAVMLVLRLAESVCVIPWLVVRWCKGTYGGASR